MLLKSDFYTIGKMDIGADSIICTFKINPQHPVFEGHFPGQPVVPGVCMIQILKELLESCRQQQLFLKSSRQIKFLQFLVPDEHVWLRFLINFDLRPDGYSVQAQLKREDQILFKFQGAFSIVATA